MKPQLIVLRGNSGSGKSSVVEALREQHGRGIAYIEQDYVRRTVFQELAEPDGANIELIGQMALRSRPATWPSGTGRRICWTSRARRSSTRPARSTRPSSRSSARPD